MIRQSKLNRLSLALAAAMMLVVAGTSQAVVLSYDGFSDADYTVGDVNGQTYAGTGYAAGAWTSNSDFAAGGLTYTNLQTTDGVRVVRNSGEVVGNLAFSRDNNSTDTVYYSFLAQSDSTAGFNGLNIYNGGTENLGVGKNSGSGNFSAFQPNGDIGAPATTLDSDVHLFVVKVEYNAGANNDVSTVWLDPDVTLDEASQAAGSFSVLAAADQNFNQFRLRGNATWNFDEIRFGTTFEDVTPQIPVPEPATASLLALCGMGLAARRRRRLA